MIWIISGPTNAGKSTFIGSARCAAVTGLPASAPVIFASASAGPRVATARGSLVHYNILRAADIQHRRAAQGTAPETMLDYVAFDRDPRWVELSRLPTPKSAIVLVADRRTLCERATRRRTVEIRAGTGKEKVAYRSEHWLNLYAHVDLLRLYRAWCAELTRHGICYMLLDSRGESYPEVGPEALLALDRA